MRCHRLSMSGILFLSESNTDYRSTEQFRNKLIKGMVSNISPEPHKGLVNPYFKIYNFPITGFL